MRDNRLSLEARKFISFSLIGIAFFVLLVGLIKLQVFDHARLQRQSENNRIRVVPVVSRRGIVYDREGRIIIDNRPSYTVSFVSAEAIPGISVPRLSELVNLDSAVVAERIRLNTISRYQPAPVKRDVPFSTVAILEEQSKAFPGITYQSERVRRYTTDLHAECYTGHVGEVSEADLSRSDEQSYRLGAMIGKKGLESIYDNLLRGVEGTEYIEVSASGQILGKYEGRSPVAAIPGADLTLTIDLDLQYACAQALDTFCCGSVVAIDPRNGEILAMASFPGYDANIFSSVIPESLWTAILSDSTHPLLNRPIRGLYPPASTTKLVTLGAALEEGLIHSSMKLKSCVGGYQFGNRFFRCWKPAGHGTVDVVGAIEESCDVYLYQVGLMLGIDRLSDYLGRCGFGKPTGIDIPGEADGLNPNSEYLNGRYGKGKWSRGLVLNFAIGQGEILSTPLQLAQLFCGLANKGVVFRPHLVKKVSRPSGPVINIEPQLAFRLPFSSPTMEILLRGLRQVVEGKAGTAKALRNDYYSIGGKTGTAENPHGENHSWFVGFAPLENPEIVVCALVENAGHGSEIAAPIVGRIIAKYMSKKLGLESLASQEIEVADHD